MFDWLADPEMWIALGTLTALEIVLGIDNIIFISVLVGRLPERQRTLARRLGLTLHPTIKILALSFLILVGVTLMVEGFDVHVPKGYIYFAMAFSVSVEMLNLRVRARRAAPIKLHSRYGGDR